MSSRSIIFILSMIVLALSQTPTQRVTTIANALQSNFYNSRTGLWNIGWWNNANTVEALAESVLYTKNTQFNSVIDNAFTHTTLDETLNNFFDDMQWWALAWVKAYENVKRQDYLQRSVAIWEYVVTNAWDNTCKGGVWWSKDKNYKNAITNELFLMLSTQLYLSTSNTTYLNWAIKEWSWFEDSGMLNSHNLINDGLDAHCNNNGQETWTYNQGVILGGLTALAHITNNNTLLEIGENIVSATIHTLVHPNGVLKEPCEPNCGGDGPQFKGVFMRYLGFIFHYLPEQDFKQQVKSWIQLNADSIWNTDRSAQNTCGVVWIGPVSDVSGTTQTAALDCFNTYVVSTGQFDQNIKERIMKLQE